MYQSMYDSPVGLLQLITNDGISLSHVLYPNQHLKGIKTNDTLDVFKDTKAWLREYFKGNYPEIKVPLAPKGTDFQQKVWNELQTIRYRELKTYGEIAKTVGVVGKDGNLTGYGGTLDNKIKLLKLEEIDMTHLYRPKKTTKP
ncbi:MAG: methylated-DNA--[protein]-cysteine S-methyltransferase [Staphylococcus epidermidis]|nr:methylated-DNA--[protein]-cysteine S-methyltransferase [Staphylococcus epidermidis]